MPAFDSYYRSTELAARFAMMLVESLRASTPIPGEYPPDVQAGELFATIIAPIETSAFIADEKLVTLAESLADVIDASPWKEQFPDQWALWQEEIVPDLRRWLESANGELDIIRRRQTP